MDRTRLPQPISVSGGVLSDLAGSISFIGVKRFYIKDFKVGSKTGCDLERYCIAGAQSAAGTEGISEKWYPVLEKCYEADPSEEMVAAICTYLIRGQQFAPKYHVWYERGIDSEIRITNLYEAF